MQGISETMQACAHVLPSGMPNNSGLNRQTHAASNPALLLITCSTLYGCLSERSRFLKASSPNAAFIVSIKAKSAETCLQSEVSSDLHWSYEANAFCQKALYKYILFFKVQIM